MIGIAPAAVGHAGVRVASSQLVSGYVCHRNHAASGSTSRTGWLAWCEPRIGRGFLWSVGFSASTPHDFVAAFTSSLASPDPVLRHILPGASEGQLSLRPTV
ncbi:DUF317 domain-containing protein [Streptomyces bobili]|uniref:DUF317 domain-containing protein n=1 Tax=Streptomyces bobili TaxID=67280 RepID=UPI003788FE44